VARGFVSQRFGRHPHPVLKHVTVDNRGVDIQTEVGEQARAIFDGKVLTVANIAGMNNVVMVQHGEYFTVYAKLRTVSVTEGQQVKMRQPIGTVFTNPEGTTELQFQVWRNSTNLNPEQWLGRK
jgi:septal ring factor EnvC (AmiA/AmiB activator)